MGIFVSVSAVSERTQLQEIARIYREEGLVTPLAIGYQVSHKSINTGSQNSRQPRFAELGELDALTRDLGLLTAVHYYTKDNGTVLEDLNKLADVVKPGLLQFNTLPPDLPTLNKVKCLGYQTIFKVAVSDKGVPEGGYAVWKGEGVQDVVSGDVTQLLSQVSDRWHSIDFVMFDPSHGTNLGLNLDDDAMAIRFGRAVVHSPELSHLDLVYAGGINPHNVSAVTSSLSKHFHGRFCIDAESGLRTNDELDLRLVRAYIRNFEKAHHQ